MDPLIEWVQATSPLYPTCITGYEITSGNRSIPPVNSTVRSLTGQQLSASGFPYCTTLHPTVTPLTLMGPLTPVMGSNNIYAPLIDPGKCVVYISCIERFHFTFPHSTDFLSPCSPIYLLLFKVLLMITI